MSKVPGEQDHSEMQQPHDENVSNPMPASQPDPNKFNRSMGSMLIGLSVYGGIWTLNKIINQPGDYVGLFALATTTAVSAAFGVYDISKSHR